MITVQMMMTETMVDMTEIRVMAAVHLFRVRMRLRYSRTKLTV